MYLLFQEAVHKLKMTVELLARHAGRMLQRKGEEGQKQQSWREVRRLAVLCTYEASQNRKPQEICTGC